jgi:hypothetical protein
MGLGGLGQLKREEIHPWLELRLFDEIMPSRMPGQRQRGGFLKGHPIQDADGSASIMPGFVSTMGVGWRSSLALRH